MFQMSASSYYHLFGCQNAAVSDRLRRLDYAGIGILIGGSTIGCLYYGFACEEYAFWRWLWIGQVCLFCAIAVVVTLVPEQPNTVFSAIAFLIAGYSTVPGCLHLYLYADARFVYRFEVWTWLGGGILYAIGAIVYAMKCPEKYVKKKFDIWGSSHQIFHVCCLAASFLHIWGMFKLFHER